MLPFKNSNFLFISLLIIFFSFIGLFNYIIDPYNIFFSKNYNKTLYLDEYTPNMTAAILKLSKKSKFNYVVLGGSTTYNFFREKHINNKKSIYMLKKQRFNIKAQVEYLKFILELHPEIETIIFPIEYVSYFILDERRIFLHKKITVKEISRLLFSYEATLKSIKKQHTLISNQFYIPKQIKEEFELKKETDIKYNIDIKEEIFDESHKTSILKKRNYSKWLTSGFQEYNYTHLKDLKNIIFKQNKEIIFIIPPYHGLTQAFIYEQNQYEKIENLKRWIVNNFPNSRIIDFAFINKYTKEPIETTYNYVDPVHPIGHLGNLFYCVLNYYNDFKDENIYIELSKENIDDVLKWQRQRLEQYIKENNEYINNFISLPYKFHNLREEKIFYPPNDCSFYLNNH